MIDKDGEAVANRFISKLKAKKFTMARSPNAGGSYNSMKQKRDSKAVADFTGTDLFKDLMGIKIGNR